MYVITAHQRYGQTDGQTDGRTSSDPMTATLLKHVAVKTSQNLEKRFHIYGEGGSSFALERKKTRRVWV